MSDFTIFARRIKEAREQSGLKQKELAEKVGVTPQTISAYEKGSKIPTLDNAAAIAKALEVSIDWLCGTGNNTSTTEIKTLGDIAKFLHTLTSYCGASAHESVSHDSYVNCGPGIIFERDEIGEFLTDDLKMTDLLSRRTCDEDLYGRWLTDRIRSLDCITIEEYRKKKYPF